MSVSVSVLLLYDALLESTKAMFYYFEKTSTHQMDGGRSGHGNSILFRLPTGRTSLRCL